MVVKPLFDVFFYFNSMEKFVSKIYKDLKFYNEAIGFIPVDDVKQEIRFAIITARPEHVYRVASRLVYSLLTDYGFSRKKGKDNFAPFYEQTEISDEEKDLLDAVDNLYRRQNLTAREVAETLNCEYTQSFQKLMHLCFPKGLAHGGARKGSGQKKSPILIQ